MAKPTTAETIAILLSLIATVASIWAVKAAQEATLMQRRIELRHSRVEMIAATARAASRAQCFLQVSGKNTEQLRNLQRQLQARNLRAAESLANLQYMDDAALDQQEKEINATYTGLSSIEHEVTQTKLGMSRSELEFAQLACPNES